MMLMMTMTMMVVMMTMMVMVMVMMTAVLLWSAVSSFVWEAAFATDELMQTADRGRHDDDEEEGEDYDDEEE